MAVGGVTYVSPVRGITILLIVSHFMEVILVQLPHKACKVAVLEVLGKDGLGELFILWAQCQRRLQLRGVVWLLGQAAYLQDYKAFPVGAPSDYGIV